LGYGSLEPEEVLRRTRTALLKNPTNPCKIEKKGRKEGKGNIKTLGGEKSAVISRTLRKVFRERNTRNPSPALGAGMKTGKGTKKKKKKKKEEEKLIPQPESRPLMTKITARTKKLGVPGRSQTVQRKLVDEVGGILRPTRSSCFGSGGTSPNRISHGGSNESGKTNQNELRGRESANQGRERGTLRGKGKNKDQKKKKKRNQLNEN